MPWSCFPPTVPSLDALLPSTGSPGRGFSCFDGTIGALRLPAVRPAALRFLRLAVPVLQARFVPIGVACDAEGQGFRLIAPVAPIRLPTGDDRASHVPGGPQLCLCPALRPRQDRPRQANTTRRLGPRSNQDEGSHKAIFGAQSHGFGTRCLRFAGRIAPPPRKTRFRLPARLYRTGLATRRVPLKGFKGDQLRSSHPPFPSLVAQGSFRLRQAKPGKGGCMS
jgi:hypothetical protein